MEKQKRILIIGIDPAFLDFSSKEFEAFPDINAERIKAGLNGSARQLIEEGFAAEIAWIDLGETAQDVVKTALQQKPFDVVMIGAGIRVPESNFTLFENLINTIHQHAPTANIALNKNPQDTADAVRRWL